MHPEPRLPQVFVRLAHPSITNQPRCHGPQAEAQILANVRYWRKADIGVIGDEWPIWG